MERQGIIRFRPSGLWLWDSGRFILSTISIGYPEAFSYLPLEHQRLNNWTQLVRIWSGFVRWYGESPYILAWYRSCSASRSFLPPDFTPMYVSHHLLPPCTVWQDLPRSLVLAMDCPGSHLKPCLGNACEWPQALSDTFFFCYTVV